MADAKQREPKPKRAGKQHPYRHTHPVANEKSPLLGNNNNDNMNKRESNTSFYNKRRNARAKVGSGKLPHPTYQTGANTTYDSDSEATALINNADLLTSYYELRDIRVPETMTGLDFFYCFYLCVGVRIDVVEEDTRRLITGVDVIDDDNDEMMQVGAAPSPHSRQPFLMVFRFFTPMVQRIMFIFSIFCLIFYASVHFAHAIRTEFPMLRSLFVVFEMCAVCASLFLASEILTKRLIGTRIFYTLNSFANPTRRHMLKHQMGWALAACVVINMILPVIGILDDLVITKNQPTVDDLFFLSQFHFILSPFWSFCSIVVNIQLVCGVTVFAGISSIYLVRINSCVRLLKQPNTKLRDCFTELFDLDVSLSDLSALLDFRLSVMLVSSFLTFFFQSIFLSNSGVDFSEGINSFLSFLHPALICFVILGTTGGINANIKRLKLVAYRFAVFKQKLMLDRKRKETKAEIRKKKKEEDEKKEKEKAKGKKGGKGAKGGKGDKDGDDSSNNNKQGQDGQDNGQQSNQDTQPQSKSGSPNKDQGGSDKDKDTKEEKPKVDGPYYGTVGQLPQKDVDDPVEPGQKEEDDGEEENSKLTEEEQNPTLVDLIQRDEATKGNEDMFDKELEALKGYLSDSTVGISLLGFQLDESFTWGFLVLSMSSVMSLTNLDQLNFL